MFLFPNFFFLFDTVLGRKYLRLLVVSQFYESQVYDEYVIKGNAAVLKCNIPSFVSDHVEVVEWVDSNELHYTKDEKNNGKLWNVMFTKFRYDGGPISMTLTPKKKNPAKIFGKKE